MAKTWMKRTVIVGATSGIGRALTEVMRAEGFDTVAAGRRAALLGEIGGETLVLDASDPEAPERVLALHPDTVIFNAGFGERTAEPDWERTERALRLNVVAFERFAQAALKYRLNFVATASVAGIRGIENTNGYSPSKAYMIAAMEGYRRKIRSERLPCKFVTVLPGFVDTVMGQASSFWRCSPKVAAWCILSAMKRRKSVVYVTPRWHLIALLMRLMPGGLYERLTLRADCAPRADGC